MRLGDPLIAPRIQLLNLINIFFSYWKIRQSREFAMATKIYESREVKDITEICREINLILHSTMLILIALYTAWIFLPDWGREREREMQVANRSNTSGGW